VVNKAVLRESSREAYAAYESLKSETEAGPASRNEDRGLVGSPSDAIDRLTRFGDLGAELFIIEPPLNDRDTRRLLVEEVFPSFT
jgi:alkanesulfonate monooxygenase SsuD/methylene tetrahydromethanopterin reductase-like flavin-dependent oxidoreductase (luciferase family)